MPRRLPILLAFALAALPAAAQPGTVCQPDGDGYEVRTRVAVEADCAPSEERLFGGRVAGMAFASWPSATDPYNEPDETLSLWHRGAPVDTLMWEDLAPEDHPVPEGTVRDLTGDGVPELVVGAW